MNATRFDRLARSLSATIHRRALLLGTAGLGAAATTAFFINEMTEAKRKDKDQDKDKDKGAKKPLCRRNGSSCKKKSASCKSGNCLSAPISIEAQWSGSNALYNTYFFVPKEKGNPQPSPFISVGNSTLHISCTPAASACEADVYPFACISQDAQGPGPEVVTVRKLLKGTYEYWFYVINNSKAGAVTVTLRDADSQTVRTWSSPANPNPYYLSWHVADIDGATGSVKSIDTTNANGMPGGAHFPHTDACPGH